MQQNEKPLAIPQQLALQIAHYIATTPTGHRNANEAYAFVEQLHNLRPIEPALPPIEPPADGCGGNGKCKESECND